MKKSKTNHGMDKKPSNQKRCGWLLWGLIICVTASAIYLSFYRLFSVRVESLTEEYQYPLSMQSTMDWLMENTYVLYRDLRQQDSSDPVNYKDIYVKPKEDCEWVLNENYMKMWISEETLESLDENNKLPGDAGRVYSYLNYFDNYFAVLEDNFYNLNGSFNYVCEDLDTGKYVCNLNAGELYPDNPYFYVSFLFDKYGNCTVENTKSADNQNDIRRMANQSARNIRLVNDKMYTELSEFASVGLDKYMALGGPVNCRVIYYITNDEWNALKKGENNGYYSYWSVGAENIYLFIWFFVMLIAVFIPMADYSDKEKTARHFKRPLELICVVIYSGAGVGAYLSICMMSSILSGRAEELVMNAWGLPDELGYCIIYGANLLALTFIFATAWYTGLNLRDIRSMRPKRYIKERSLIYRIFPSGKRAFKRLYDSFAHFDVTKKANKLIIKLVFINGVVLLTICVLWMGGLSVAIVYSIILYFVLRKYISDLQKKYGLLLNATNEIAQGNLNVVITEDLGVFEPFKPQVYRIQQGFRKAVDNEVKSQRMRAELITNVSHDLKTPLTAIITYINLLKEDGITDEQRREYLDTLERKSLRLKVLIEDLFEVSKADSQNMTLNIVEVDIINLIKQVAFELGDKFTEMNLDMRLNMPDEKIMLALDSQRTYRIYENLFGNIAKYAMPGTRVYVNADIFDDRVVVILKNITAQELSVSPEELTERFVRGDESRNTEGSGLGLAIAKSFAQLQGGTLTIELDGDLFKVITVWQRQLHHE